MMEKRIQQAEKRITELIRADEFKALMENERNQIGRFFEERSMNRLLDCKDNP